MLLIRDFVIFKVPTNASEFSYIFLSNVRKSNAKKGERGSWMIYPRAKCGDIAMSKQEMDETVTYLTDAKQLLYPDMYKERFKLAELNMMSVEYLLCMYQHTIGQKRPTLFFEWDSKTDHIHHKEQLTDSVSFFQYLFDSDFLRCSLYLENPSILKKKQEHEAAFHHAFSACRPKSMSKKAPYDITDNQLNLTSDYVRVIYQWPVWESIAQVLGTIRYDEIYGNIFDTLIGTQNQILVRNGYAFCSKLNLACKRYLQLMSYTQGNVSKAFSGQNKTEAVEILFLVHKWKMNCISDDTILEALQGVTEERFKADTDAYIASFRKK